MRTSSRHGCFTLLICLCWLASVINEGRRSSSAGLSCVTRSSSVCNLLRLLRLTGAPVTYTLSFVVHPPYSDESFVSCLRMASCGGLALTCFDIRSARPQWVIEAIVMRTVHLPNHHLDPQLNPQNQLSLCTASVQNAG
ncbi:hypothetical protein IWZ01DRAFT_509308 [Phyllosticta capitalensis]